MHLVLAGSLMEHFLEGSDWLMLKYKCLTKVIPSRYFNIRNAMSCQRSTIKEVVAT